MGALVCALWLLLATQAADLSLSPAIAPMPIQARFDAAVSQASFTVHTRWLSAMTGRFNAPEGTLETLPDGRLQVLVSLRAASVAFPGSERTTRWTRSDAFFDVNHYPVIRFRSEPFPRARLLAGGMLDGLLELRGVSKPVHFVLAKSDCAQPGAACPIHADGSISRRAFGMTRMLLLVRDDVEFAFNVRLQAPP